MYHGMDIDWEKMEEVARTSSARDVLIGNAEDAVVEAAVTDRLAARDGRGDNAGIDAIIKTRAEFNKAVDALIALREGQ